MADIWRLPKSVTANGHDYAIRTDFRAVLDLLTALSDKDIQGASKEETAYIHSILMLEIMVPEYENVLPEDVSEMLKGISDFIDMGAEEKQEKKSPRLMDWEQDANIIIPEINKVAGREVRELDYLHWWTFMSYYMGIGEGTFSHVVSIRQKRAEGKKLEKWEQEFLAKNKEMIILHERLSDEEQAELEEEKKALEALLG